LELGLWFSWNFMFFGMLQFYFTQNIFGDIGLKPTLASKQESKDKAAKVNLANIVHDRIIAVLIFYFTVFFWASFEQAGGSMTILPKIHPKELFGIVLCF
jgi:POT family proton-dependent oligopeptide transporter